MNHVEQKYIQSLCICAVCSMSGCTGIIQLPAFVLLEGWAVCIGDEEGFFGFRG